MLVYIANVEKSFASVSEVERWNNNNFSDDLSWRSISRNIDVFDQYEKAEKRTLEELKRNSKIYGVKEVDECIFVKPMHIGNTYKLGNIRYKYHDNYYIVHYEVQEFEVL